MPRKVILYSNKQYPSAVIDRFTGVVAADKFTVEFKSGLTVDVI